MIRKRSWLLAPLLALLNSSVASAEMNSVKFMRVSPQPTTDEKTNAPAMNFIVEIGKDVPITTYEDGCFSGGKGDKINTESIKCVSSRIEKEGYFKSVEFPKEKAQLFNEIDGEPSPMEILNVSSLKESTAAETGVAWLILIDGSSSVDKRWDEIKETATAIVKNMGERDVVMVRIMDDKSAREKTKWLAAGNKNSAINLISRREKPFESSSAADSLMERLEKETKGSFQDLIGNGVEGMEDGVYPMLQAVVILSDGNDSTLAGAGGGTLAKAARERLLKGDIAVTMGDINLRLPTPVISIWFPKSEWSGAVNEQMRAKEYSLMQNIATPEVGGFFAIVQDGEAGKGAKLAKKIRERFDNMYWVTAKTSCLATTPRQTFTLAFTDKKYGAFSWKDVPIALTPDLIVKWLLDINKKKTEEASANRPLLAGETFDVFGNFCWGTNTGAAEAYFITEADAADVKKAGADKTGKKARELLQDLAAKGQKAETVQVGPTMARFKAPNTPSLFDKKDIESWSLNVIVLDTKSKRVSTLDQKKLLVLKAVKPPVSRMIIIGAIAGGVVLILLIAILARGGGGGGRKRRRGGGGGGPAPMPGQPPGAAARAAPPMMAGYAAAPMGVAPVAVRKDATMLAPAPPLGLPGSPGALNATAMAPYVPPPDFAHPVSPVAAGPATEFVPPFAPGANPGVPATHPPATEFVPPVGHGSVPRQVPGHSPGHVPSTAYTEFAPRVTPAVVAAYPAAATEFVPGAPMVPPASAHFASGSSGPTVQPGKAATSFHTACPSCGKPVMVPPGGSAQCVFCGALVDSRGSALGAAPRAAGEFGLTGHVNEEAARAALAGLPGFGSTVSLQGEAKNLKAVMLLGDRASFRLLPGVEARLGRDGTLCNFVVDESHVSSAHASLRIDGASLLVRDDQSHNGTYVNGNRIQQGQWVAVPFGSQLRFGPLEFTVRPES